MRTLVPRARRTLADLGSRVPVLLVGAGQEADLYLRALQRDTLDLLARRLSGRLSAEIGALLRGVPVLGTLDDFEAVVTELEGRGQKPRHLIFTAPPSHRKRRDSRAPYRDGRQDGHGVSRLPSGDGAAQHPHTNAFELRPIELTDLLERPQAALNVGACNASFVIAVCWLQAPAGRSAAN